MSLQTASYMPLSSMDSEWASSVENDNSPIAPNDAGRRRALEKVPIWVFVSGNCRLRTKIPVEIVLRREESHFIAECERLLVFACGDTAASALDSLHDQVVHFHDRYTQLSSDDVIGEAAELRKVYRKHFEKLQGA